MTEGQEGADEGQPADPPEFHGRGLVEPTYGASDDQARLLYVKQMQENVTRFGEYWEAEVKQISKKRNIVFACGVLAIVLGITCVVVGIVLVLRGSQPYGAFSTAIGLLIGVGLAPLYRFERRLADEKKIASKSIEQQITGAQVTGIAAMASPEQRERILGELAARLTGLIGKDWEQ